MITKYGNLFDSTAPAIGHGVNCKGIMGAGIAKQFADRYPDMYADYKEICEQGLEPGEVHFYEAEDRFILNIATQNNLGKDAKEAWVTAGLINVAFNAADEGWDRVAIPAIGCGIGGLHMDALERAIEVAERFCDNKVEFELWLYEG